MVSGVYPSMTTLAIGVTLDATPVDGAHVREVQIDGVSLVLGLTLA